MSFDSVYKGPLESRNARQIKGRNQVDVRYQLKERIKGVVELLIFGMLFVICVLVFFTIIMGLICTLLGF